MEHFYLGNSNRPARKLNLDGYRAMEICLHGYCSLSTINHLIEIMTYTDLLTEIKLLVRFMQFFTGPSLLLTALSTNKISSAHPDEDEDGPIPPTEDFPLFDDEINPNREVPEEEEAPVEEPPGDIEEDPYFPRKGEDLPPEKEEEFPRTDPV